MASGTFGEFYCGTYIRGRIRWSTTAVSGGHNVELHMDVYRTNIYNGDIVGNRQTDTLYVDGQTAEWYNTTISNQRTWHELFSTTKFVSHSAAKTITIGWSTTCTASYYNGSAYTTIDLEALGRKADGLDVNNGLVLWNKINISGSLSDWGVGPGPNYVALAVFPGDKDVNSWGGPRLEWTADNQGNTKSWTDKGPATIPLEGGLTLKGCFPYKIGMWANNRYEAAWTIKDQVYYTPPATPVKAEVVSDIPFNKTKTRVTIRVTESSTDNLPGAMVKTVLGDTYTGENSYSAKHAPGTPVDFTLELNQNTYHRFNAASVFYWGDNDKYSKSSDWKESKLYITNQMEPPSPEYSWNDTREVLSITAKANSDYANYMQIRIGYNDDSCPIVLWQGDTGSEPVTNNWSQTSTIAYPDHGAGQFIYVQLRSRYRDGTWEDGEVFAIPVPNPILGLATYSESNKKYIVDVVEHKSDDTVTPMWQNGQRIVKK